MKSRSLDCQKQKKRFCDEQRQKQPQSSLEHCAFELQSPLLYCRTVNTMEPHGLALAESTDEEDTKG